MRRFFGIVRTIEAEAGWFVLTILRTLAIFFSFAMVYFVASTVVEVIPAFSRAFRRLGSSGSGGFAKVGTSFGLTGLLGWTLGKIFVFSSGGVLGLRVGLGEVLLPRWEPREKKVLVLRGVVDATVLQGRPGLAAYVSLEIPHEETSETTELVVRCLDHEGNYLPATRGAFRGAGGEFLVRRSWNRPPEETQGAAEIVVFVPLRALQWGAAAELKGALEVLVFHAGKYQSETKIPVSVFKSDPRFEGLVEDLPKLAPAASVVVQPIEGVTCPVCGDELDRRKVEPVSCVACDTPHHRECWDFMGQCSVFACEGDTARAFGDASAAAQSLAVSNSSRSEVTTRRSVRRVSTAFPFPKAIQKKSPLGLQYVSVPRASYSIWEFRPITLLYTASLAVLPFAFLILVALFSLKLLGAIAVFLASFALALPAGFMELLVLPGKLARPALARAFPARDRRDFSHFLRLRRVEQDGSLPTGGVSISGMFLVQGLYHHRIDVGLRLRSLTGEYIASARTDFSGVYGEIWATQRSEPLEEEQAHALEFRLSIPGDAMAGDLPKIRQIAYEVLIFCEGEVLSEADGRAAFQEAPTQAGRKTTESGFSEGPPGWIRPVRFPESDKELPAWDSKNPCPLCNDRIGSMRVRCQACRRASHPGCWDFRGVCSSCGSPNCE